MLQAVAYTNIRDFMLCTDIGNGWRGNCLCSYRGHLTLHQNSIEQLINGESIKIGNGWCRLLEKNGVANIREHYPFERKLPHPPLLEWDEYSSRDKPIYQFHATPAPIESHDAIQVISQTLVAFSEAIIASSPNQNHEASDKIKTLADKNIKRPLRLFFSQSEFKPDCIRIPKSEIDWYMQQSDRSDITDPTPRLSNSISQRLIDDGKRENQLHTLINRLVIDQPRISTKVAWQLIQADCNSDAPLYDLENILYLVDEDCIEWKSRNGIEQTLKWTSFRPLLSKLKSSMK
jgi:hypothetical protein